MTNKAGNAEGVRYNSLGQSAQRDALGSMHPKHLLATLSGLRDEIINDSIPRALPWAIKFHAVGVKDLS